MNVPILCRAARGAGCFSIDWAERIHIIDGSIFPSLESRRSCAPRFVLAMHAADWFPSPRCDRSEHHGSVCPCGVSWVQRVHAAWLDRSRASSANRGLLPRSASLNPLHPACCRYTVAISRNVRYRRLIATTGVGGDLENYLAFRNPDIDIIPTMFTRGAEFSPQPSGCLA